MASIDAFGRSGNGLDTRFAIKEEVSDFLFQKRGRACVDFGFLVYFRYPEHSEV